jgi:hypothetical protein
METCANCHRIIGDLEGAYVYRDSPVCARCYSVLVVKPIAASPGEYGEARRSPAAPLMIAAIVITAVAVWFFKRLPAEDHYKPAIEPFVDALVKSEAESTDSLAGFQSAIADAAVAQDKISRELTGQELVHHKSIDEFGQALAAYRSSALNWKMYDDVIALNDPDSTLMKQTSDARFQALDTANAHLNLGKDLLRQGN